MNIRVLSFIAIFLAAALTVLFFVDSRVNEENSSQKTISNNVVMEDSIQLLSGDTFTGQIIGQTEKAVLLRPMVYGQVDKVYTFQYENLKKINYDIFDPGKKPTNPLALSYYEIQLFKKHLRDLYDKSNFDELERKISKYRKGKDRFSSGQWKLDVFYKALLDPYEKKHVTTIVENLYKLERWKEEFPTSLTVAILLIETHTDIAWKYRGTTFSSGISADGRKKFNNELDITLDLIEETKRSLAINDPHFYRSSVVIYKAQGLLRQELPEILQKSINFDPEYYNIYTRIVPFLMPRWGGYSGEVEDFADKVSKQGKVNESYARVAANIRQYAGHSSYRKFNFDWERIKDGYNELQKKYPANVFQLHSFAWMACYYGDYKQAKIVTDKIGYAWNHHANRVWKQFQKYYECKNRANSIDEPNVVRLHDEVREGNYPKFLKLIEGNIDLNKRNEKGETALYYAINTRFYNFAKALINRGADIRIANKYGEEPIHKAARWGSTGLIGLLLEKEAPVNVLAGSYRWSPLHYAAKYGHYNIVDLLLNQKNIDVNQRNNQGRTPLHLAIINGSIELVTLFINHEHTNINSTDFYNNTALNLAQEYNYETIQALLKAKNAVASQDAIANEKIKLSFDYQKKGVGAYKSGHYVKAREFYLSSIDIYPNNANVYGNIALIDMHEQNYEACLDNTQKALDINQNNARAIFTTAQCLYLLNKPKEEYLAYYKKYISLKPNNYRTKEVLMKYPELR